MLSKFRHPNLVILMGFARNGPERLLVYELLAGGDVHRRLRSHQGPAFGWEGRRSAALDAACGLSHLHHSSPKVGEEKEWSDLLSCGSNQYGHRLYHRNS